TRPCQKPRHADHPHPPHPPRPHLHPPPPPPPLRPPSPHHHPPPPPPPPPHAPPPPHPPHPPPPATPPHPRTRPPPPPRPHHRAAGGARVGAGENFRCRAGNREPHRGAHAGDRASLHRQSADRPWDGQPVLDPSFDREPHRRTGAIGGGDRFRRIRSAADRPRLSATSGRSLGQSGRSR